MKNVDANKAAIICLFINVLPRDLTTYIPIFSARLHPVASSFEAAEYQAGVDPDDRHAVALATPRRAMMAPGKAAPLLLRHAGFGNGSSGPNRSAVYNFF
jgi:hypothetical protein